MPAHDPIKTIYLAGPDVFRPDALTHQAALKSLCATYGFTGVSPSDKALPPHLLAPTASRAAIARFIYAANVAHIDACDAVLANLAFFRGAEPDSGTCFEIGYAVAKGKPVYAYVPEDGDLAARIGARCPGVLGPKEGGVDADGWKLEDFGHPVNLMLAVSSRVVAGDAGRALEEIVRDEKMRVEGSGSVDVEK